MKTQKEVHPPMTGLEMEFEEQVAASQKGITAKRPPREHTRAETVTHARMTRREREMEEAMTLGR